MNVRRPTFLFLASLALVILAGCGQKTAQSTPATLASSDTLLASSPVEQPQGQIQPQTDFKPQTEPATTTPTPAPAPTPKAVKPVPKKTPAAAAGGTDRHCGRWNRAQDHHGLRAHL